MVILRLAFKIWNLQHPQGLQIFTHHVFHGLPSMLICWILILDEPRWNKCTCQTSRSIAWHTRTNMVDNALEWSQSYGLSYSCEDLDLLHNWSHYEILRAKMVERSLLSKQCCFRCCIYRASTTWNPILRFAQKDFPWWYFNKTIFKTWPFAFCIVLIWWISSHIWNSKCACS